MDLRSGFPGGSAVKNPPAMQETWVQFLIGKIPWKRAWQPTLVFLPEKSHGQRSLVGYSPWGGKESDTAERLHFLSFFEKQRSWPAMLRRCLLRWRAMVLWVEL